MNYAPGLNINWTDKELSKIQEIKSRSNRLPQHPDVVVVPREGLGKHEFQLKEIRNVEKKRNKIKAINLLYDADYPIIRIADMFNIPKIRIERIVRNHSMGNWEGK